MTIRVNQKKDTKIAVLLNSAFAEIILQFKDEHDVDVEIRLDMEAGALFAEAMGSVAHTSILRHVWRSIRARIRAA